MCPLLLLHQRTRVPEEGHRLWSRGRRSGGTTQHLAMVAVAAVWCRRWALFRAGQPSGQSGTMPDPRVFVSVVAVCVHAWCHPAPPRRRRLRWYPLSMTRVPPVFCATGQAPDAKGGDIREKKMHVQKMCECDGEISGWRKWESNRLKMNAIAAESSHDKTAWLVYPLRPLAGARMRAWRFSDHQTIGDWLTVPCPNLTRWTLFLTAPAARVVGCCAR